MTKIYKTARGKMVDIDQVKLANEQTIAVGNMKVNARGDQLGAGGAVVTGRNEIQDQVYAVADAPYSPNDPATHAVQSAVVDQNTKNQMLHELVASLVSPVAAEDIVVPDLNADTTEAPEGSLASAVAKPTVVKQVPTPRRNRAGSSGPSRI
jgi:hypothetical protein